MCKVQKETLSVASSAHVVPALSVKETNSVFLQDLEFLKELEGMWHNLTPVFLQPSSLAAARKMMSGRNG